MKYRILYNPYNHKYWSQIRNWFVWDDVHDVLSYPGERAYFDSIEEAEQDVRKLCAILQNPEHTIVKECEF